MDLQALDLYVAVMRASNFASVARDRNLDPSSVSRQIAALEEELGLKLFHRTTRKLTPTEAGLVYFSRIEPLIEEFARARLQAMDVQDTPQGTLRIHAPVSFGQIQLVPLLPAFAREHPNLHFELILNDRPLNLLDERIDVALRTRPLAEPGSVVQKLAPLHSRVCASPGYLQKHGRPSKPADLKDHRCLLLEMPGYRDVWHFTSRAGHTEDVMVQGPLKSSNAIALKDLAVQDMGIILQAGWIVQKELNSGLLVDVFPEHRVNGSDLEDPAVWLLYPTRTYLPLKVRVFVEFLQKQFQAVPS
ncbi:LysR family transcriptional regulator [Deinococcus misasensis]|uniref:LysR family transcriptional regulator n=1 Tax=Deinococcus misasensis TaxID=392413 RepID=UPI00055304CC|nr:LysR family transcriptional regulator [Deinococcus misasensis]